MGVVVKVLDPFDNYITPLTTTSYGLKIKKRFITYTRSHTPAFSKPPAKKPKTNPWVRSVAPLVLGKDSPTRQVVKWKYVGKSLLFIK